MAKDDKASAARLNVTDELDQYELGAEVDGVFVPFVTVPGPQVRAHVENAKAAQAAAERSTSPASDEV